MKWLPILTAPRNEFVLVWRGDRKRAEVVRSNRFYHHLGKPGLAYTHWCKIEIPKEEQ